MKNTASPDSASSQSRSSQPLILGTVWLGYFMASWAMGPVASILPSISSDLDLSVNAAGWIMSIYFVMLVGTLLVMGRLGDLFGHGRVFGLGVGLYTAGTVLCGLAPGFITLLIARGVQGVGSAMIFSTSLAIIALAISGQGRAKAISLLNIANSVATFAGVTIATWSVQNLNWHWAFLAPIPFGIAGAIMGLRLRMPRVQVASRQIDWAGGILLFATLTSATLALNHLHEGPETFEEGAPYHVSMHLVTIALLVAFLKVEQRAKAPLLRFGLLRDSKFSSGVVCNGIAHMSMLATSFLVPFLLERGRGLTPSETGFLMIFQQMAMVVSSVALGFLYDRTKSPIFAIGMMVSIAGGLVTLGLLGASLPYLSIVAISMVLGAGLGGFTTVNNTAVMSMAPQDQRGFAAGLVETTRQLGHAVGISVSSSFMGAALAGALTPTPDHYVNGFQDAALAMGLLSSTGVLVLLWPWMREAFARLGSTRSSPAERQMSGPRPVAGGSD